MDVDVLVRSCLSLTPQQETFLGRQFWRGRERGERGREERGRFIFNTSQAKISRCLLVSAVTIGLPTHTDGVQNKGQYMSVCISAR
jgi:hypothetical protein